MHIRATGTKGAAETLSAKPGLEYIFYTHGNHNINSAKKALFPWNRCKPWMIYGGEGKLCCDPHACLGVDEECKLCKYISKKNGQNHGRSDRDPHTSLKLGDKCPVCKYLRNKTEQAS